MKNSNTSDELDLEEKLNIDEKEQESETIVEEPVTRITRNKSKTPKKEKKKSKQKDVKSSKGEGANSMPRKIRSEDLLTDDDSIEKAIEAEEISDIIDPKGNTPSSPSIILQDDITPEIEDDVSSSNISCQTSLVFNASAEEKTLRDKEEEKVKVTDTDETDDNMDDDKENQNVKDKNSEQLMITPTKQPLTPSTKRNSILKNINTYTPNTGRSVIFNSLHEECHINGKITENNIIPTDQDTRGSKKRRHLTKERKMELFKKIHGQDNNLPINSNILPVSSNSSNNSPSVNNIPQKVQPGFLSRGLSRGMAMLQAVSPMPGLVRPDPNIPIPDRGLLSPNSKLNGPIKSSDSDLSPIARRSKMRRPNDILGNVTKFRKVDTPQIQMVRRAVKLNDISTNTEEKISFEKSEQTDLKVAGRSVGSETNYWGLSQSCEYIYSIMYYSRIIIVFIAG